VTITPLDGVPGGGMQAFVQAGGLKLHEVPHSTVRLVLQSSVNTAQPVDGGLTWKRRAHAWAVPFGSEMVTLMA